MCGIFGSFHVGTVAKTSLTPFIKQAFVTSMLRGTDSSGILQVDTDNTPYVRKDAVDGATFSRTPELERYAQDAAVCPATICHVRARTQGNVSKKNAHPFIAAKDNGMRFIGVHNGTLHNWKTKPDGDKYEVDSEWAMNHLAKHGKEAFKDFQGAFAMVWWDEETPDKIYMARNGQRPLHILLSSDKKDLIFASEAGMLSWLAERNNIITDGKMYELPTMEMFTFNLSSSAKEVTWEKTKIPFPVYNNGTYSTYGTTSSTSKVNEGPWPGEDEEDWGTYLGARYGNSGYTASGHDKLVASVREAIKKATQENEEAEKSEASVQLVGDYDLEDYKVPEKFFVQHLEHHDTPDVEIEAAKKQKVFGNLQWFEGVFYDGDDGELWGDIEEYIPGQGKITHTGVIRGMSQQAADMLYCTENNTTRRIGDWAIVVGTGHSGTTNGTFYTLLPIPNEARKILPDYTKVA